VASSAGNTQTRYERWAVARHACPVCGAVPTQSCWNMASVKTAFGRLKRLHPHPERVALAREKK